MADKELKKKYKERVEAERQRDRDSTVFAWELISVEGRMRECEELMKGDVDNVLLLRERSNYDMQFTSIYKLAQRLGGKAFLQQVFQEKERLERAIDEPKLEEADTKRKVISFDRRTLNRNARDELMRPPIFIDTHVGTIAAKNVKILFDIDTALDNVVEVAEIVYDPANPLDTGATVRLTTRAPLVVDGEKIE